MGESGRDYYAILGVPPDATLEEIQRAYRRLARRYHPDQNDATGALERFLEVQEAYQVLSDPQHRAAYDATLPVMAEAEGVLSLRHQRYPPHLMPLREPQLFYLLLTFQTAPDTEGLPASSPLNLALALDRSTSMKGARMQALIKATEAVIRELDSEDIFAIVAFDDRAEVLVPATRGANKEYMAHQLRHLMPRGGTEMYHGLRAAYEQVQRFRSEGYLNHILLITDGHTYGDEEACLQLAREAAQQGIIISALGIGSDWNDAFLDELTAITGGSCWHIARAPHLERLLRERFRALGEVLADKALVRWYLPPGVTLRAAFRATPDPGPLALEEQPTPLGVIQRREPLQVLFEFLIAPEALEEGLEEGFFLLPAQFLFSIPGKPTPWHRLSFRLRVPVRDEPPAKPPTRELAEVMNRFTVYRMQEKARASAEVGDIAGATRRLEHLATRLLEMGHHDMAALVRQEATMLQRKARLSPEATKALKFGTRALFLLPPGSGRETE